MTDKEKLDITELEFAQMVYELKSHVAINYAETCGKLDDLKTIYELKVKNGTERADSAG